MLTENLKELWRDKSIIILTLVGIAIALFSALHYHLALGATSDVYIYYNYTDYIAAMSYGFSFILIIICIRSILISKLNQSNTFLSRFTKVLSWILVVTGIFTLSTLIFVLANYIEFGRFLHTGFISISLLYMYVIFVVLLASFIASFTKKLSIGIIAGIIIFITQIVLSNIQDINKFIPGTIANYSSSLLVWTINTRVEHPDLIFNVILTAAVMIVLLLLNVFKNIK